MAALSMLEPAFWEAESLGPKDDEVRESALFGSKDDETRESVL
jgi:hypothetical protein